MRRVFALNLAGAAVKLSSLPLGHCCLRHSCDGLPGITIRLDFDHFTLDVGAALRLHGIVESE